VQAKVFKIPTDLTCHTLSSKSLLAWRRLHWKPAGKTCGIRLTAREGIAGTSRARRTRQREIPSDESDRPGERQSEVGQRPEHLRPPDSSDHEGCREPAEAEAPKASALRAEAEGFVPQSRLSATAAPFCPGGDTARVDDAAMFQEQNQLPADTLHQEVSPEYMVCDEQIASFGEGLVEEAYTFTEADPAWWYEYQWNGDGTGTQPESVGFPMEELNVWEYIDPKGKVHGKFSCLDMRAWFERGYFPADLRVKYFDEMEFVSISSVYPAPEVPFASFPAGVAREEQKEQSSGASDRDTTSDPGRLRKGKAFGKAGTKGGKSSEGFSHKGGGKGAGRHAKSTGKGKGGKDGSLSSRKEKGKSCPPGDWSGQGLPWQGKEVNPLDRAAKTAGTKRQWVVKGT